MTKHENLFGQNILANKTEQQMYSLLTLYLLNFTRIYVILYKGTMDTASLLMQNKEKLIIIKICHRRPFWFLSTNEHFRTNS